MGSTGSARNKTGCLLAAGHRAKERGEEGGSLRKGIYFLESESRCPRCLWASCPGGAGDSPGAAAGERAQGLGGVPPAPLRLNTSMSGFSSTQLLQPHLQTSPRPWLWLPTAPSGIGAWPAAPVARGGGMLAQASRRLDVALAAGQWAAGWLLGNKWETESVYCL